MSSSLYTGAEPDTATDPLGRFVEIERRRREIEDEDKRLAKEAAALQEQLLNDWADRGQQSATVAGFTIYVAHEFYCSKHGDVPTPIVCEILAANGLGNLVAPAYNANSLKAWIKERVTASEEIPEELKAAMSYGEVPRLRTRLK